MRGVQDFLIHFAGLRHPHRPPQSPTEFLMNTVARHPSPHPSRCTPPPPGTPLAAPLVSACASPSNYSINRAHALSFYGWKVEDTSRLPACVWICAAALTRPMVPGQLGGLSRLRLGGARWRALVSRADAPRLLERLGPSTSQPALPFGCAGGAKAHYSGGVEARRLSKRGGLAVRRGACTWCPQDLQPRDWA